MTFIPTLCSVCRARDESIMHLFRDCYWARQVWAGMNLDVVHENLTENVFCWLNNVFTLLHDGSLILFILTSYWIWSNRNKVVFELLCENPSASVIGIRKWHDHLVGLDQIAIQRNRLVQSYPVKWQPPDPGFAKINFAASFIYGASLNCFGVVARNRAGFVLAAEWGKLGPDEDAYHAEACAANKALELACSLGLQNVQIEGDCLRLITELQNTCSSATSCGVLVDAVKEKSTLFDACSFHFAKRSANAVADCLSRLDYSISSKCFSDVSLPVVVLDLVHLDAIFLVKFTV
ncbi:uncharacterized protein [Rutidosis leptorrhynchoides]|uniref:uncharacterized protein n=1 Tax=Rutidosis leptorrhynchoides TaxID=125765 RepID=UPI003A99358E